MNTPATGERYVDAATVAAHLSVTRRVVLNLARAGKVPAYPVDPTADKKIWRFKLSEIEAVLTQNQLGARPVTRENCPSLASPSKARNGKQNG